MSAQSFNLEQTNFALDTVKDTQETVAAMKGAAKALKVEQKKINIDEVEDCQDDLAEMMFDMNEIQESLGRSFGLPDEVDECDLDAELDMLGDELEEDGLADTAGEAMPDYLQPARKLSCTSFACSSYSFFVGLQRLCQWWAIPLQMTKLMNLDCL